MSYKFTAIIQKDDTGLFVATCTENNVASQGKTIEEAQNNLREALELYYEDNEPVEPPQTYVTTIEVTI